MTCFQPVHDVGEFWHVVSCSAEVYGGPHWQQLGLLGLIAACLILLLLLGVAYLVQHT